LEKLFKIKQSGSKISTEIIAGLTTFFTMAYIIVVNPNILAVAGLNSRGVFVATILAAVIGTLIMGLVANVPYAQAPGMGLNAFFTYTVCIGLKFQWQEAMAMVFICGLINIIITVTKIRKTIIKCIPTSLQSAIGGGIGLFIAYIGIKGAGLLKFTTDFGQASQIINGPQTLENTTVVPGIADLTEMFALLALIGLVITVVLMVLKVKGAIFIGIIATTLIGIPMGVTVLPEANALFDIEAIGDIKHTAFAFFGDVGFKSMFSDAGRIFTVIITIFAFSLSDTFDTIGTFIGTGRVSGIFDAKDDEFLNSSSGFKSKMDKALFADATATSIGALLGTSNTTTYVESAAGIQSGGRTGLTSVVVAGMFLLCLPFANVFGMVPGAATAPALIIVGVLMAGALKEVDWTDFEIAVPCFLTLAFMAFAYSISTGIAAGFIFYVIIQLAKGKAKEVHPILYGATLFFILNYVLTALQASGVLNFTAG